MDDKDTIILQERYKCRTTAFAEGTFGKIFLGRDLSDNRKIVIKKMRLEGYNPETVKREGTIMQALNHPNILKCYDSFEQDGLYYLVLEFIDQGNFLSYWDYIFGDRSLTETEIRPLFQQIIRGLQHCHQRGVVHRDIKPANILVDSQHCVYIADFGISNMRTEPGELFTSWKGTPDFIAPEVARHQPYAFEPDIWSAGIFLYYVLSETYPFHPGAFLHTGSPAPILQFPDHFTDEVKDLLKGMLDLDRNDRTTITEIMDHGWFNA